MRKVQRGRADARDKERLQRLEEYRKRVRDVKKADAPKKPSGDFAP